MLFKRFFTRKKFDEYIELEINDENTLDKSIDSLRFCTALTLKGTIDWDGIRLIRQLRELTSLNLSGIKKVRKLATNTLPHDTLTLMKILKEVTIPAQVPVDSLCITECISLERVIIPKEVKEFSPGMVYNCDNFTEFIVDDDSEYFSTINGVLVSKDKKQLISVPCGIADIYEVPDSITQITKGAFFGCSLLTEVVCDVEKITIDEMAFRFVNVKIVKP